MKIETTTRVGEIVVEHPETGEVFESFGIDYCCGGDKTLADAVTAAGVDLSTVMEAIQKAFTDADNAAQRPPQSWGKESLTKLVDHIESTHHVYTKKALQRLDSLFTKVLQAHGENHGHMLNAVQPTFSGLRTEVETHLMKEEQILFPYIRHMEGAVTEGGDVPPMHCGTLHNPINQMEVEHENAGAALARMRSLTNNYTLPGDACHSFEALFSGLQELEADLHEHIHLENNILFPRALAMEDAR